MDALCRSGWMDALSRCDWMVAISTSGRIDMLRRVIERIR